jgi:DNA-binding NarL/FixJ family response regulator
VSNRSTRELWPDDEESFLAELDALEAFVREGIALAHELQVLAKRSTSTVELPKIRDALQQISAILGEASAYLKLLLAHPANAMHPERAVLLNPQASDDERSVAAAEFASRVGLHGVIYDRRRERHEARLNAAIADAARDTGRSRHRVIQDVIAQGALIAGLEARHPQEYVEFVEDKTRGRLRYVRGSGGKIVPIVDLPVQLLVRWMDQQISHYVLDQWVPDWRERESVAGKLQFVDVDSVVDAAAPATQQIVWQISPELERLLGEKRVRLAELVERGYSQLEAGNELGISHGTARNHMTRSRALLKHLLRRKSDVTPPGD